MSYPIRQTPIAVVGMACRLPGARNPDEFWRMLVEGRSAIGPIPDSRLDRSLYYDPRRGVAGATYAEKAALIDYAPDAEPDEFLSAAEIADYDLAHVVLCRVAREAVQCAGITSQQLAASPAGVYVGHATGSGRSGEYSYGVHIPQTAELLRTAPGFAALPAAAQDAVVRDVVRHVRRRMPWRTSGANPNLHASASVKLVASKFGLDGPQMTFNSACASSLQAIAHAMKALSLDRVDTALAGGSSCFHSDTLVLFAQAQSLSATGSHPFTEGADGLIVGEGSVVFVLKRLEDAVATGLPVLAVLPSVGVSSDGRGKSLWAPRGEGQVLAIRRAYENGPDLRGLQYVEAHATSTSLGDRTEIESVSKALGDLLPPGAKIAIGGVKRNIGHTLEAAGAAGLLKVILAMRHGEIPPAVDGSRPLAKDIDWQAAPVFVNDAPIAWPAPAPGDARRAGVNAFGIGGLNVHLVVEGYDPAVHRARSTLAGPRAASGGRSVAIVGVGVVAPGAKSFEEFKEVLRGGRCQVGEFPSDTWDPRLFTRPLYGDGRTVPLPGAGSVRDFEYDWRKHKIPPKQLAQANPLQFMMLDAVEQALGQSSGAGLDAQRTGCVVGSQFGGDFSTQLICGLRLADTRRAVAEVLARHGVEAHAAEAILAEWRAAVLRRFPALIDESGSFTASALASRITKSFDLMGGGIAVDASDLGAFAALSCSIDALLTGDCDTMICVAGEHNLLPENYQIAALRGILASSAEQGAPFDERSNGTVPAEGCVAVVLKRLDDARRDGHKILGVVEGIGAARRSDRQDAIRESARRALRESGLAAPLIRGVSATGQGIPARDRQEAAAIENLYGEAAPACASPTWTFGWLGSAAGFVTLAAGLDALESQSLSPTRPDLMPVDSGAASAGRAGAPFSAQAAPLTTPDPLGRLCLAISGAGEAETSYHVIVQRGEPVMPQPNQPTAAPGQWQTERLANGAVLFDATVRRREKMRRAAASGGRPAPTQAPAEAAAPPAHAISQPRPQAAPAAAPPVQPAPSAPVRASAVAAPASGPKPAATAALAADEVETFLVNFVVDQTGYPREIVELDADLESDLGIDSIKKAQLFGELGEYFDVRANSELSLDDFSTLRAVRDYLLANASGTPEQAPPIPSPASVAPAQAPRPHTGAAGGLQADEVEAFLVNFVVDQTGYPREIVELDADLESDLGIDSIKKAQLFGELGEYFDARASGDLSLDDFSTLRAVRDYLLANASGGAAPVTQKPAEAVIDQPEPVAAMSASAGDLQASEVEAFLINFVVEQTGYPQEIVELDADLESDLGIDSIKKAQLFGELGEYFDVKASGDLSLDEFATLRAVRDFLLANAAGSAAQNSSDAPARQANATANGFATGGAQELVVQFFMEQTGYPRSVIDLDGDFEIDLGLDDGQVSQMLNELGRRVGAPELAGAPVHTPRDVVRRLASVGVGAHS